MTLKVGQISKTRSNLDMCPSLAAAALMYAEDEETQEQSICYVVGH